MTSYNSVLPLDMGVENPFRSIIPYKPYYFTEHGSAYLADSLHVMHQKKQKKTNTNKTTPPNPLTHKKENGNVDANADAKWLTRMAAL